ncbi:COMM domain-containing protein 5-like isoform X3 [Homarus americanus]|uniref:COMM domain-containing protein 5-like isoform X3 n=1 Tax=Homarus americanus TaxID=6706 RepID=UPI001C461E08|nr:COMM domain-containing protein 5-like isoform X3 [Homarus americanus]
MVIMAVPGGVHENVIFTASVPSEVKTLVKASHNMDKIVFRKLIKLGLGYLQGGVMQEDQEAAIKNLCDSTQPVTEKAVLMTCVQYAGIVSLLRAALRVNTVTTRQDILLADLTNFGLPEEFASDVCKVVFGPARLDIDNQLVSNTPALPVMTNLNWRVEVTISTRALRLMFWNLRHCLIAQHGLSGAIDYSICVSRHCHATHKLPESGCPVFWSLW